MSTLSTITVFIQTQYGKEPRNVVLKLETWDERERLQRALKFWGMSWGLAVCTVPIPLAHFIFPPFFLFLGPYLFVRIRKQKSAILESAVDCPECGLVAKVPKSTPNFPLETLCGHCQSRLILSLKDTP